MQMTTKDYQNRSLLSIFLSFFPPHKKLFLLDMVCAFFAAAIDLVWPMVSRTAMMRLLPQSVYGTFFTVMGIMLAAFCLRAVLYYVIAYWGHTFGIRVETDIRQTLFEHIQTLGFDYFGRNRTGQLMSRLTTDLWEVSELAHHGPEDLLISLATILGALAVLATIQWRLALVIGLLIPVFLLVIIFRRRAMSQASREVKVTAGEINSDIESSLSGIRTAKAFANEELEIEKFRRSNARYRNHKRKFYHEMGLFLAVMELFLSVLSVAVIAVGGWLIMRGEMDYVDLITFSMYLSTFISPIRKLVNFSEQFANGFAGLGRFAEIMRTEPTLKDAPDAVELTDVRGSIDMEDVSFSYSEEAEVLRHVTLAVAPGETVAVVGPSGGGKTTLCQLIPRFYDVSEGAVKIDGTDVRQIRQDSLHRKIGIVQQDVFLFAGTVEENIRYGRPDATAEEVAEAARRAEIYDDIMAMPEGFGTYVGERGVLLSGGQKQRIAIARIFLKNPPILILDEATSALDSVTEARIQRAFDELAKGRTTLIIAHRLSTIRSAGRILVISDGEVTESGSHEELMALDGAYARLYRTQTQIR